MVTDPGYAHVIVFVKQRSASALTRSAEPELVPARHARTRPRSCAAVMAGVTPTSSTAYPGVVASAPDLGGDLGSGGSPAMTIRSGWMLDDGQRWLSGTPGPA